jgi:hypothetical protein
MSIKSATTKNQNSFKRGAGTNCISATPFNEIYAGTTVSLEYLVTWIRLPSLAQVGQLCHRIHLLRPLIQAMSPWCGVTGNTDITKFPLAPAENFWNSTKFRECCIGSCSFQRVGGARSSSTEKIRKNTDANGQWERPYIFNNTFPRLATPYNPRDMSASSWVLSEIWVMFRN